jgi:hypothetical protein
VTRAEKRIADLARRVTRLGGPEDKRKFRNACRLNRKRHALMDKLRRRGWDE